VSKFEAYAGVYEEVTTEEMRLVQEAEAAGGDRIGNHAFKYQVTEKKL
jgi:hypothetical protein